MKTRSIIIIGAGIGGLVLARLLAADGHRVTVIERAKDFTAQGHSIGFRGVGFQVMEELGLREEAERTGRKYRLNRTYSIKGDLLRTTTMEDQARAVGGVAVTQRGLLHAVLSKDLPSDIDLRFGLKPVSVTEREENVVVELDDGSALQGDIVVGADGANSMIRNLVLPGIEAHDFGGIYVGMTVKTDHGLPLDEISTFFGTARTVAFFPVDLGTVAVVLYQDDGYGPTPTEDSPQVWASYLDDTFADAPTSVRRILGALKPGDDVFHDRIVQIPPTRAVSGRVVLVGDAGYCPTFFSGNGAALASAGAYCLAKCLRNCDDDRAALQEYERRILPFAAGYQANARRLKSLLFTRSKLTIAVRELVLRYTPAFLFALNARRHYRGEVRLADAV